jgi:hypothetical protein
MQLKPVHLAIIVIPFSLISVLNDRKEMERQ